MRLVLNMELSDKQRIIYGLTDPRTEELRYVGMSKNGLKRAKTKHDARCRNWEIQLERLGLRPDAFIIEDLPSSTHGELCEQETFWIGYFRMIGANLTNMTNGGDGVKGSPLSKEHKQKISIAIKGRMSPNKGNVYSEEICQKMSASHLGKKQSTEHIANRSRALKGRISAWKGKTLPPEMKIKMSEAAKLRWAKLKGIVS